MLKKLEQSLVKDKEPKKQSIKGHLVWVQTDQEPPKASFSKDGGSVILVWNCIIKG